MGVGLKPHLPDGTYTATYRVISADTHIVYGGLVFNIGHAGRRAEVHGRRPDRQEQERRGHRGRLRRRARPRLPLDRADARRPRVPARSPGCPGLRAVAGAEPRWPAASRAFAARLGRLFAVAIVLGVLVSVLGILLQGASAAGVSLWSFAERLDPRKHARKPLRQGVGAARDRLGRARRAARWRLRAAASRDAIRACSRPRRRRRAARWRSTLAPARAGDPRAARDRRALPGDHAGAGRSREHPEPGRRVLPLRRAARARGERVGRRDRLPAARAARRDPPARARRAQPAAARDARALLPARARRGDRDRGDRRDAGVHRRAQPARPAAHHLRRADHRQGRAAAAR